MAGFSKVYFVGSTGGFMGADGLAFPFFQIMVGDAGRQWLEVIYNSRSQHEFAAKSNADRWPVPLCMGSVMTVIPAAPNDPVGVMDAVIAFYPRLFRDCPSIAAIEAQLRGVEVLDFDTGDNVPADWPQLRAEALPRFRRLAIFEADLRPVEIGGGKGNADSDQ